MFFKQFNLNGDKNVSIDVMFFLYAFSVHLFYVDIFHHILIFFHYLYFYNFSIVMFIIHILSFNNLKVFR